jgi:hypothetical protein
MGMLRQPVNHRRALSLGPGRTRVAVALPRCPEDKKKQARQR